MLQAAENEGPAIRGFRASPRSQRCNPMHMKQGRIALVRGEGNEEHRIFGQKVIFRKLRNERRGFQKVRGRVLRTLFHPLLQSRSMSGGVLRPAYDVGYYRPSAIHCSNRTVNGVLRDKLGMIKREWGNWETSEQPIN